MEDQRPATCEHIQRVRELLHCCIKDLLHRALHHDSTKLVDPERSIFDEFTPKLRHCAYESPEYKTFLEEMKPALDHHYACSRHHPEHFDRGIDDMNLIDLLEMFIDWKAASERHEDGDINVSIQKNQKRFGYSDQLREIFENTAALLESK